MKHSNTCTFKPIFSFKALKERYKILSTSKSKIIKKQANEVLAILDKNPILVEGIESLEVFEKHKDIINEVMVFLFPTALNENEIKAAILPFSNKVFYSTNRLDSLLNDSSVNIDNLYKNMSQNSGEYIDFITYAIILNKYYKFNIDFNRPIQVQFTNSDGHIKTYRAAYNDDFLEIYPNKNAVAITDEILTELLSNTNDKDVWDKYFPENSWTIKGFGILNMIDTTLDEQIDLFKTHLIEPEERSYEKIINDIKQILSIDDLIVGGYYLHGDDILPVFEKNTVSITFDSEKIPTKKEYACKHVYETLFTNQLPVVISNVEFYHKRIKGNRLSKILIKKDIKSLALLPMDLGGGLKYIHELGSKHTNRLNAINLVKLKKLMPFMQSFSERAIKVTVAQVINREKNGCI